MDNRPSNPDEKPGVLEYATPKKKTPSNNIGCLGWLCWFGLSIAVVFMMYIMLYSYVRMHSWLD